MGLKFIYPTLEKTQLYQLQSLNFPYVVVGGRRALQYFDQLVCCEKLVLVSGFLFGLVHPGKKLSPNGMLSHFFDECFPVHFIVVLSETRAWTLCHTVIVYGGVTCTLRVSRMRAPILSLDLSLSLSLSSVIVSGNHLSAVIDAHDTYMTLERFDDTCAPSKCHFLRKNFWISAS